MLRRCTFTQWVGAGLRTPVLPWLLTFAVSLGLVLRFLLEVPAGSLPSPLVPALLLLLGLVLLQGRLGRLQTASATEASHEGTEHRVERVHSLFTAAGRVLSPLKDRTSLGAALTRLCVPEAADACVLLTPREDGTLRPAAAAHARAEEEAHLWEQAFPVLVDGESCLARVLRTGRGERFSEVDLERLPRGGAESRFLREFAVRSCMLVPLAAGPRVLGVLVLLSTQPRRPYSAVDQAFMDELAGRAALALDNARLTAEAQGTLEYIGVAAHDLASPLCALQFRLHRLRTLAAEAEPRVREGLVQAELETRLLGQLLHNLLDLSRLDSGPLAIEPEEVDLSALARELVDRHAEQALASGCALTLQASPQALGRWDRLRLERVLTNLLSNAFKFGRGAPIEVRVHAGPEHVRLSVRDHGAGIPAEAQARIFERFERAPGSGRHAGVGLGLYIVRQLVEAHGGTIRVASQLGKGSEFTVDLPRALPVATERVPESAAA